MGGLDRKSTQRVQSPIASLSGFFCYGVSALALQRGTRLRSQMSRGHLECVSAAERVSGQRFYESLALFLFGSPKSIPKEASEPKEPDHIPIRLAPLYCRGRGLFLNRVPH